MRKSLMLCLVSLVLPSIAAAQSAPAERDVELVYRIVSAQTVSERRVVFRSVTPEMKAALWRAHVRHFLNSHPELSEAQRGVIAQFIAVIVPDLYRQRPDDAEWQALIGLPFARMQQSASAILTPDLYREALATLGPAETDAAPAAQAAAKAATSRKAPLKTQPDYCVGCWNAPDCECNMGDNWCGWGQTCAGDNCKSDSWGCGTMWQSICNGMCH
ncbi:MAG TPA: bacteriocin fulvocin C-related protein [Thermoanaerobaculia bacterium]|nr:bacteriocin fulvocin C-related protein [Thermoanaerobaculia bacterium]